MIIVRVARGITDHFPARASEWVLAVVLIWLGVIFLRSPEIFDASMSYAGLARFADEAVWGRVCILIGSVRLAALVINGTFAHSWYGRVSPPVRGACAFLSCLVWAPIFLGFIQIERDLLIQPYSAGFLVLDLYNIRRVFADAGRTVKAARDAARI